MEVQQEFGDQVQFIGVPSLSSDVGSMESFVSETGATGLDHIPDVDGVVWNQFGVNRQRTYVVINNDGTWEVTGYGSLRDDVIDLIAR